MSVPWWVEVKGVDTTPHERLLGLKELKRRVPMVRVLQHYGLKVQHNSMGDWQPVPCPFHKDSRPSASVNTGSDRFRCHVCDIGGDVIDVVAHAEGLDTKEAMRWISQNLL